jgi:transglutaminase-like putative cysteine protease
MSAEAREIARLLGRVDDAERGIGARVVDLMRAGELAGWLPAGTVRDRIRAIARDDAVPPLVRAAAWWWVRADARAHLDAPVAEEAASALGLLDGFAFRAGSAPEPTAPASARDLRTWPTGAGHGVVELDAVLRPARETAATLMTTLSTPGGGPAVLRVGYDDEITVWLNGDELYRSPEPHDAWLDQAAIPIVLRPGANRLVVEVRQRDGVWRFMARVTDAAGTPRADVVARPEFDGPPPDPAEGDGPDAPVSVYETLRAALDTEPADAEGLRDLADFARRSGLPGREPVLVQVALEGAWAVRPAARVLRSWMRLLPEAERLVARARHEPPLPVDAADAYESFAVQLTDAWDHYYARRVGPAWRIADALEAAAPDLLHVVRLRAVLLQELGFPNRAAALVDAARGRHPGVPALDRAYISALGEAGRTETLVRELERLLTTGEATADEHYRLAELHANRGSPARAVDLLDRVARSRADLWQFGLQAAEVQLVAGNRTDARDRLEQLSTRLPGEPVLLERRARIMLEAGERDAAIELVEAALRARPNDPTLGGWLESLGAETRHPTLGPPLDDLRAIDSPQDVPAHVLYHHARTDVGASGLAVRHVRRVVRVLDAEGARRFASWDIPYVPAQQSLHVHTARLLRDGHPPVSPERRDVDLSEPEYRLYYDLRAQVLDFPPPRPGDVIELAWTLADLEPDPSFPGYYGEVAYLQESVPRAIGVIEVRAPEPDALSVEIVDRGLPIRRDGLRFEGRDIPAVPLERGMPGASEVRAYVHVSTLTDWLDAEARYRTLLVGRDQPNEAISRRARRWAGVDAVAEGDLAATRDALERLYRGITDRTRYVGLELGVHSFQPEAPSVTLARGYGDCKDRATLLIALARALGIDARFVLVRSRTLGAVAPKPASFALFDHAIVYVPVLGAFMDPTVDHNAPWTLPPSDQAGLAFVLGEGRGPRPIPAQPADHNLSAWSIDGHLGTDGRVVGTLEWATRGFPATVARRSLAAEGTRAEVLREALSEWLPGAGVERPAVEGAEPVADPLVARASVRTAPLRRVDGAWQLPRGVAPWRLVSAWAESASRTHPLQLDLQRTERRTARIDLPPGTMVRPPEPVLIRSPFGEARAHTAWDGDALRLDAEVRFTTAEIRPEAYGAFRRWLTDVERALNAPVRIMRGGG